MSRSRSARRLLLAGMVASALAVGLLAGCGSSPPPGTHRGAGGVRYQWPPTNVAGAASQGHFCRLLVDDYQHLKSIGPATAAAGRVQVLRDFAAFAPAVVAAAPPAIAPAASTYLHAESGVLLAAVKADFDEGTFDRSTLVTLASAPVAEAGLQLQAYAKQRCHYDPAADPALAPRSS